MRDKIAEETSRQGMKMVESMRVVKERNQIKYFEVKK